ncbi:MULTISPECIES: DUF6527 family protein [unclassified Delftia]|uniref:DUF6527 family protein n=1 Tax=unclassified Delftia TaxID=2613839 RepID=UPI0019011E49|nr:MULTISPECIES: DUF6527 family protein [unclassified Delftia]MBK0116116.1 hypothetical protein [Delftia sp. S65]MBK0121981.1 hypothetical protein [Delftia sp. S67]MBK0132583.1 hypothetical protein [Delftia sp. S66]
MTVQRLEHLVVHSLPEPLKSGILYVTSDQDLAAHLCACGCGKEVITPLSPTDWELTLRKDVASLWPSIGNWSFPCRSHYIVRGGRVVWASDMSEAAIQRGRQSSRTRKDLYYSEQQGNLENMDVPPSPPSVSKEFFWKSLLARVLRFFT